MKKLRVAFLVDSLVVSQYVYELVKYVTENELFDHPVAVCGYKVEEENSSLMAKIFSKFKTNGFLSLLQTILISVLIRLIRRVERVQVSKHRPEYGRVVTLKYLTGLLVIKLKGEWSKSKLFLRFNSEEIEILKSHNIDIIVRCGSGILKGEILSAARFGILSFHHGDNRVNRGGPSGFWEVLNDEPSSGFIIQQLSEELDGGDVLFRGNIMTSNTWSLNNANLLAKSNFFFKKLLNEIAINDCLPKPEFPSLHDRNLYKLNNISTLVRYYHRVLIPTVASKILRKLFGEIMTRWSIAYAYHDDYKKSLWRYKEIENPNGRFLADPFVYQANNRTIIFAEDYFYSDNRGRISAIDITDGKEDFLGVVLEDDVHLSFPFVFENEGTIYMIPETSGAREIRLYECTNFPIQWRFKCVLMNNVSAADTIMFRKDNRWFMITNICSAGIGDHQSELHIFWSDELESKMWQPIASGNPVIFDSEKARNGGMFTHRGDIYRVNQINGKNHYGKCFGINKIKMLDKNSYEEVRVNNVTPCFKKDIISTHHFNSYSDIAVVDYCRKTPLKKIIQQ